MNGWAYLRMNSLAPCSRRQFKHPKVLTPHTLYSNTRELLENVRNNDPIDWTIKESVQAKLRVLVKRTIRKYGYPPDKQAKATETVLKQAELMAGEWQDK